MVRPTEEVRAEMPITKTEFHTAVEERIRELMRRTHSFLGAHKDLAYSEAELRDTLGVPADPGSQAALREALRALDGLEAARWGIVGGEEYYIYHQDLPDLG
jgi:hypothetical protein